MNDTKTVLLLRSDASAVPQIKIRVEMDTIFVQTFATKKTGEEKTNMKKTQPNCLEEKKSVPA